MWSVLVDNEPETTGILETSAVAGIGAAMLRVQALNLPWASDVAEAGWRAVRGALASVDDDGTLTRVSAGTVLQLIPFGYSVIRDDRIQLWGQGLALHAVAAAIEAIRESEGHEDRWDFFRCRAVRGGGVGRPHAAGRHVVGGCRRERPQGW